MPAAEPKSEAGKIVTTQEELDVFETIRKLLGPDRPVAYFKVHLADHRTWVFARLYPDRIIPCVWVPLPADQAAELSGGRPVTPQSGWTSINLDTQERVADLGDLLRAAFAFVKTDREWPAKVGVSVA